MSFTAPDRKFEHMPCRFKRMISILANKFLAMTLTEATKLRDDYLNKLVGRHYDENRPDWEIKDIIVSDKENAANVYAKMYDDDMSNEKALNSFSIKENDYEALIIAHPWSRSTGDILVEEVQNYLKANPGQAID